MAENRAAECVRFAGQGLSGALAYWHVVLGDGASIEVSAERNGKSVLLACLGAREAIKDSGRIFFSGSAIGKMQLRAGGGG